jgi:hypothetical protein
VIRVPEITGLPIMTLGSATIQFDQCFIPGLLEKKGLINLILNESRQFRTIKPQSLIERLSPV